MRIISKTLTLAALLFAVALPATAASAACPTDPYCNPDTPDSGGRDSGRSSASDNDRGDVGDNDSDSPPVGGVAGAETTGGAGEVGGEETTGGAGEVEVAAEVDAETSAPVAVEAAAAETQRSAPSGTLPLTGGDVAQLAVLGVGAIGVGAVLVRRSRASRAAA